MSVLPLILLIEDDRNVTYPIKRMLEGRAEVLVAEDVETGWDLAFKHRDELRIITFDAWMPLTRGGPIEYDNPGTVPLVAKLKSQGFKGRMIAASACISHNGSLLDAGCTDKCPKGTGVTLIEKIEQLLGLSVPCG